MFPIIGDVVIRTNSYSTDLKINASLDTVKHYDMVGNVTIEHVAKASYDEFGRVAGVCAIEDGRIEVQDGGEMTSIVVKAEDIDNVVLDTVGDGTVGIVFVKDEPTKNSLETENNKGVNEWIYEFFDENGVKIDPTAGTVEEQAAAIAAIQEKIEEIATESRCYIKENYAYYKDIKEAFAAVQTDQAKASTDPTKKGLKTVILTRDFTNTYSVKYDGTAAITINQGSDVVFDLNGHIFTGIYEPKDKQANTQLILNKGKLTIQDRTNSSGKLVFLDEMPDTKRVPNCGEYLVNNTGTLYLESGTLQNDTAAGATYCVENTGTFIMNGGAMLQYKASACRTHGGGKTTMNDGYVYSGASGGYGIYIQSANGKEEITINGGTIEAGYLVSKFDGDGAVTINDGLFIGEWTFNNATNVNIYGGKSNNDFSAYCAEGYRAKKGSDDYYTIEIIPDDEYACKIGEKRYGNLEAAIASANTGDEIKLINDVSINGAIWMYSGKKITIDLNGKTLKTNAYYSIYAYYATEVTFKNGTIDACGNSYVMYAVGQGGTAKITFDNIKFINIDSDEPDCTVLNYEEDYGTGVIVIKTGTYGFDPTSYVDTENYNVTKNGDVWEVTAK